MDKWICQICGQEFDEEVDLLAHQFNSPCEDDLQELEAAQHLRALDAALPSVTVLNGNTETGSSVGGGWLPRK